MKWIIVFYQIIMALPEGEIIFSGLDLGNKFIKTESILSESYVSQNECEKKLVKFKGKNKISEVDTFYSKNAKSYKKIVIIFAIVVFKHIISKII